MSPEDTEFSYVATFPPLTDEQLDTLARLLRPSVDAARARATAEATTPRRSRRAQ